MNKKSKKLIEKHDDNPVPVINLDPVTTLFIIVLVLLLPLILTGFFS